MSAIIGGGRALRVCDICGGVDDHPRHSIAGTYGEFERPSNQIVALVQANCEALELDGATTAQLLAELFDTAVADRHMDCCAAQGCPTGDCDRARAGLAETVVGQDFLGYLTFQREQKSRTDLPPTLGMIGLMSTLLRFAFLTVGMSQTNLINAWLNVLRGTTFTGAAGQFIQLHTNVGDPGSAGTSNVSSVTTRMSITWNAPAGSAIGLSASVSWTNWAGSAETIAYLSLWSAASAGTFYTSFQLTTPRAVNPGDTLTLTSASVSLAPTAA